jgi:hypothetical protein
MYIKEMIHAAYDGHIPRFRWASYSLADDTPDDNKAPTYIAHMLRRRVEILLDGKITIDGIQRIATDANVKIEGIANCSNEQLTKVIYTVFRPTYEENRAEWSDLIVQGAMIIGALEKDLPARFPEIYRELEEWHKRTFPT